MAAQENVVIFSIIIIVPFLSFLYVHTWYGPNVFLFIFPISSIGSQSVSLSFAIERPRKKRQKIASATEQPVHERKQLSIDGKKA